MSDATSPKLRRLVIAVWISIFGIGAVMAGAWLWKNPLGPIASPSMTATGTASATIAFTPTSTFTPSLTLTPTRTFTPSLTPTVTETPVPFSEGPIPIGTSVEGRPLQVYRFGTGSVERLIVAGMHGGNEFNTVVLGEELMGYIRLHPETVPRGVTLYFLHALNPDGVARSLSYLGRVNSNDVDLNRNWPVGWKKDWNRTGCWTTTFVTPGKKPGSEPETQALMAFVRAHHFSGLINYHSAALGVFPGGFPPTDDSKQLAQAIADISTYSYPPIDTGCEYTGGMVDWTANEGVPSVDLELTDHTHTDFEMNLKILQMFLEWEPK